MHKLPLMIVPLLWFVAWPVRAQVYKCVTDGTVEYRDVACSGDARQQIIDIAEPPAADEASVQAAAARLKYLREADAALSARLAHERELRLQLATERALAAQQVRLAREEAARQAENNAAPVIGSYWPVAYGYPQRHRLHTVRRWLPGARAYGGRLRAMGRRGASVPARLGGGFVPRSPQDLQSFQ